MTTPRDTRDGPFPPRRRPGPKSYGRTVIPLTITVTHAQRAALEVLADMEKSSISTVVRRFVAGGLAAPPLGSISSPRTGAVARRAAKEQRQ